MWYKCDDCGHTFEEGEQRKWLEDRGEYWGSPCSEELSGCPLCGGDYEEVFACINCGELSVDKPNHYCKKCENELIKKVRDFFGSLEKEEKQIFLDLDLDIGEFI